MANLLVRYGRPVKTPAVSFKRFKPPHFKSADPVPGVLAFAGEVIAHVPLNVSYGSN
jgi:hypothetical protein